MDTQHRCRWPGCPENIPVRFLMCKRHWDMVPQKLRGWMASTFRPGQLAGRPSPDYVKAISAVKNWCKANPDPKLPPFAVGEVVKLRDAGLFAAVEYIVTGCEIKVVRMAGKDRQIWFVKLSDGGEWPAKELSAA